MDLIENTLTFLEQNRPSKGWKENLDEHLPATGAVTIDVPLIRIVDEKKEEILVLKANEICTDEQLRKFNFFPPDGMWVKWGELAVRISGSILPGLIKEGLTARGLYEVPASWRIEFYWLREEKNIVGEFR